MNTYLAFLRGINVGGKNIIPMNDLREAFTALDYRNVKTYLQSGNVRFDADETNISTLKNRLKKALIERFAYAGPVILRRLQEIQKMVEENPFHNIDTGQQIKLYVCFLERLPDDMPGLPMISEKEALEIFRLSGMDLFVISRELKRGRFGFPNNYLEKELGVLSTARNWNTVVKIVPSPAVTTVPSDFKNGSLV